MMGQRYFSVTNRLAMRAKTIILNKKFDGFPTQDNFKIVETTLPAIKDGEFLAEAEYLSVDPYMRVFSMNVGQLMMGEQVAKIIESKNPNYPVGEYVVAEFGWRSHTIGNDAPGKFFNLPPRILKDYGNLPRSLALGVLGMPGNTAYFGLLRICKPIKGNTVVVSSAAGAVGNVVGQIAKIHECRVVGITGSDEKGERLIKEANFDVYVNYKSPNFEKKLIEATPDNIDCYFDNVGGEISTSVLNRMNKFAHVAVSGSISSYNEPKALAREVQTPVKVKHVTMEGFSVTRWRDSWNEGIEQNKRWIKEGQLKHFETVTHGFENMSKAFIGMFHGESFGKSIVKV